MLVFFSYCYRLQQQFSNLPGCWHPASYLFQALPRILVRFCKNHATSCMIQDGSAQKSQKKRAPGTSHRALCVCHSTQFENHCANMRGSAAPSLAMFKKHLNTYFFEKSLSITMCYYYCWLVCFPSTVMFYFICLS